MGASSGRIGIVPILFFAASCTRIDAQGPEPPVLQDVERLLSLSEAMSAGWDSLHEGPDPRPVRKAWKWVRSRATDDVRVDLGDPPEDGIPRAIWSLTGAAGREVSPGTAPELYMTAPDCCVAVVELVSPVETTPATFLRLTYRKVEDGWLFDSVPECLDQESGVKPPVATRASHDWVKPETSPILRLRRFPPGEVPPEYAAGDPRLDAMSPDEVWQDVAWKGWILAYPGQDSAGKTDPMAPGSPDVFWELEATAVDEWLPYLDYEESEAGFLLPANSVTVHVDRGLDGELLTGVLRVLARPTVRIRDVRLMAVTGEGRLAPAVLHLRQPLGWKEQQSAPVLDSTATAEEVAAALGTPPPDRAGVRPAPGATAQQVVTALDHLRAAGVEEVFIAVLPEGYESGS